MNECTAVDLCFVRGTGAELRKTDSVTTVPDAATPPWVS